MFANDSKLSNSEASKIRNQAARLVMRADKRAHITPIMRSLHWTKLLETYNPTRWPRSASDETLLCLAKTTTMKGDAAFSVAAARLWNEMPLSIKYQ